MKGLLDLFQLFPELIQRGQQWGCTARESSTYRGDLVLRHQIHRNFSSAGAQMVSPRAFGTSALAPFADCSRTAACLSLSRLQLLSCSKSSCVGPALGTPTPLSQQTKRGHSLCSLRHSESPAPRRRSPALWVGSSPLVRLIVPVYSLPCVVLSSISVSRPSSLCLLILLHLRHLFFCILSPPP